jgi:major membrane immunogen (membrane-anchored lipoprotein)
MRKSRRNFLMAAAVSPLALTACGGDEKKPVVFKQGTYQGIKYTPPWENDRFKGDERAWQDALRLRAQNQNDYSRMGDTQRGNL